MRCWSRDGVSRRAGQHGNAQLRDAAGPSQSSDWRAMGSPRLTSLDASFLEVESPTAHMHVGWAAAFARPAEGRPPRFPEIRDHVETRLHRAPRYRQKLAEVPLGLSDPVWADDPDFDVAL